MAEKKGGFLLAAHTWIRNNGKTSSKMNSASRPLHILKCSSASPGEPPPPPHICISKSGTQVCWCFKGSQVFCMKREGYINLLGLCNNLPQTGWLKLQKFFFPVLETRSSRSRCLKDYLHSESCVGKICSRTLSLACRCVSFPCIFTQPSLCMFLCPNFLLWH